MKRLTAEQVTQALDQNNGSSSLAANALGVDERTIQRWKKKMGYVRQGKKYVRPVVDRTFPNGLVEIDARTFPNLSVLKTDVDKPFVAVNVEPIIEAASSFAEEASEKLKRVLVISDVQGRDYSRHAFSIAVKRIVDYRPTHLVIIGDFQDNTALMGKTGKREVELTSSELADLSEEQAVCNELLDRLDVAAPRGCHKYYIKGNHEDRADKIVESPNGQAWAKIILAEHVLNLKNRGWKWLKYNDFLTLGKLKFTHGAFYDMHHAYHHARVYCENVIYGHTHQVQMFTMPTPARTLAFFAASVGCLSNTNPEWSRGKPNSHDHAFAEVDFLPSGEFFPHIHRIINRQVVIDGKTYTA